MSIKARPRNTEQPVSSKSEDAFIDEPLFQRTAQTKTSNVKPKKIQFPMRLNPDLLGRVDKAAEQKGLTRTAMITFWCAEALERN